MLVAEVFGVFAERSMLGFSPVVVLRAENGRVLPIYIGIAEALAIYTALRGEIPPRPMTHDLLADVIRKLNAKVERIVIDDLIENTFYARIVLKQDDRVVEVDARPSDSIAIAVRMKVPIYVEEFILNEAGKDDVPETFVDLGSLV
ncbi:MAG: bifunctional nuclease family protein [Archaeoglobaceae archaeon]|nr:bifunctional nuclease family protein [Archaeoglobaceae archaeon]MCX8151592.1 bifunctional nuclease family protein [Archaeoglobaceae archaeon]MDW8013130.1 bifunctional nuclease family protein [Archaeoglobaceae archaeon]